MTDTGDDGHAAWTRRAVRYSGDPREESWGIAVETPIEISINGAAWTVLMGTPTDLEDLAVGLAVTEQVLREPSLVRRVEVCRFLNDLSVNIIAPDSAIEPAAIAQRSVSGNSACGLCGLESLATLQRRMVPADATLRAAATVEDDAVRAAFDALPALQPANRATYSTHAAAWSDRAGNIQLVREDVGRHNALDKLVGALARQARLQEAGFIVMTSRCSYELVYKARATGALLLATLSAPTTMALEWSAALALPVACRTSGGRVVRFPAMVAHEG